jgi:hypothetical protein
MFLCVSSNCCTLATKIELVLGAEDNSGEGQKLTKGIVDSVEQREREDLRNLGSRELDILIMKKDDKFLVKRKFFGK